MNLSTSQLRYLFTINELVNDREVRSIDIADKMGFSKPSVHRMLSQLERKELITKEKYSFVTITGTGREIAQRYYNNFCLISGYFEKVMCMSKETASEGAITLLGGLDEDKASEICGNILKLTQKTNPYPDLGEV